MLYFPQLQSGATGQYPIKKRRIERTIVNQLPDGRTVKFADSGAEAVQWRLSYQGLADAEIDALRQFFSSCEGELNVFTFLDPLGNLLAWSEDLSQAGWQVSGLLQVSSGIDDPNGGTNASRVMNPTGSDLTVQQTLNVPGWFTYSFSLYVRGQGGGDASLFRQAGAASDNGSYVLQPNWNRISLGGSLNTTQESVAVGIVIPAGQVVDVFGFQLEPQPVPSAYKQSFSASGVYPNAHFNADTFPVTTTGPNRNQCTVTIAAR